MTNDTRAHVASAPSVGADTLDVVRPIVLAVALSGGALMQMPRHVVAPGSIVGQTSLAEVEACDVIGDHAPDLVICPLQAIGFDAMDLLTFLREAGFQGRFLVLAPHMPDISLIRAEMSSTAPDLNVDIIALDGTSAVHLL